MWSIIPIFLQVHDLLAINQLRTRKLYIQGHINKLFIERTMQIIAIKTSKQLVKDV